MNTETHNELVADLRRLITTRLLDPLEILTDAPPLLEPVRRRLDIDAESWAARLLGGDDRQAVAAAAALIAALYPGDTAFDPPHHWWRTPLGRAIAERAGHPGALTVSYSTAGAMLGITRQGVADLVKRGKLARETSGGVDTESIQARLRQISGRQAHDSSRQSH